MMNLQDPRQRVLKIISLLRVATASFTPPMSALIKEHFGPDPFLILISCLLSLRARDVQTYKVMLELIQLMRTPQELLAIPLEKLEQIIKPIGFYRKKAQLIHYVAHELLDRFNGQVPHTEAELRSINGIGPKTAALVLGEAFHIPAICVDVHVHRISNRLGLINTKNTHETERELKKLVPQESWIEINRYFVMWGQNICVPISPWCSRCILRPLCPQKGVTRKR